MPRLCGVCVHPQRDEIDRAILGGEASEHIAKRFGQLSRQGVQRHGARHISGALRAVFEAERTKKARTLLARVERHVDRLEHLAEEADGRGRADVLAVSRELTAALALLGKATGEIHSGPQVQINVLAAVCQRLGVRDEDELGRLVEGGRKYLSLVNDASRDLETYRDEGIELLLLVLRERPEWRAGVLSRLGGPCGARGGNNAAGAIEQHQT